MDSPQHPVENKRSLTFILWVGVALTVIVCGGLISIYVFGFGFYFLRPQCDNMDCRIERVAIEAKNDNGKIYQRTLYIKYDDVRQAIGRDLVGYQNGHDNFNILIWDFPKQSPKLLASAQYDRIKKYFEKHGQDIKAHTSTVPTSDLIKIIDDINLIEGLPIEKQYYSIYYFDIPKNIYASCSVNRELSKPVCNMQSYFDDSLMTTSTYINIKDIENNNIYLVNKFIHTVSMIIKSRIKELSIFPHFNKREGGNYV